VIRVMIVDDDRWMLKGMRSIIPWEDSGFDIFGEATDGQMAFEMIVLHKPEVVFTDIVMPKLSGLELIQKVSKAGIKTEFVILSGHADFSYAQEAIKLGAFDYLLKPLENEELMDVLERLRQKHNVMNDIESDDFHIDGQNITSDNSTLKLILNYINENYSSKLHLYEVADHFHFNSSYISQLFSRELGISFSQYLTTYRLNMAEKLLKQNKYSLNDISQMVGINDYFYFNKLFKKYKGITPNNYKTKVKK